MLLSGPLAVVIIDRIVSGLLGWLVWPSLHARETAGLEAREAWLQCERNEARLGGIIRSAKEAIVTIDDAQRVVIFNPMAEKLFGWAAADAIGVSLDRFIPDSFRVAHREHVARFGVTGVSERQMGKQRRLYALRADGTEFPIEASISQLHDGHEKLYTVMLRDITERVQAENALRASREELERLSANIQKTREDEKTRIARELHDDLGQQLTALKMAVTMLENELKDDSEQRSSVDLSGLYELIDGLVRSVRRIAADLRPVMLDDLGLLPAIDWLVNDFSARYQVEVIMNVDTKEVEFGPESATAIFRMMQEALTNVARHSGATEVKVDLICDDSTCVARIADNGRGATANAPPYPHFGLLGLRERAARLGGRTDVQTAPGRGFVLTITLPLASEEATEAL